MAHFDADQETVDWYRKNGWKKTSPLDIDMTGDEFKLPPEELEAVQKALSSIRASRDSEPDSED